jgi:uncharacterized membrane protein YccC
VRSRCAESGLDRCRHPGRADRSGDRFRTDQRRYLVAHRVVGTLAGAAIAAGLALTLPGGVPTLVGGVICAVVAVAARLQLLPYALFVAALTPAVVLLGSHPGEIWTLDLARVGYTLIAAVAVIVASIAGRALLQLIAARAPDRGSPTPD